MEFYGACVGCVDRLNPQHRPACHRAEASRLLGATGLERVAQYDADGREGNLNRYFVLRSRGAA